PPPTPPSSNSLTERLNRKRQQAEALRQGRQAKANPSKPGSVLRKRFWKEASVKETPDGLQVLLDIRPVRTASKQPLTLPKSKRALAAAIATEWDQLTTAQQALKQHYIPLTSLTSRAIDLEDADAEGNTGIRDSLVTDLMRYLSTDTLLCWAPQKSLHEPGDGGKTLRERQVEVAEPIIAFLKTHIFPGVDIIPVLGEDSIMPIPQPEMTKQIIKGWVTGLPAFELAALERGVLATKSLLIGARLMVEWSTEFAHLQKGDDSKDTEDRFTIEKATEAATTEVAYQTQRWGEVEDTHDVDAASIRQQLGSAVLLVS
ncbi:ATP12-domain-containing protein, partial [Polychaeton citri CBS 116435]